MTSYSETSRLIEGYYTLLSRWVGKIPWKRSWQPTPVFLPGESHGQRRLVGYSRQGRKESDTTEETQHASVRAHILLTLFENGFKGQRWHH